MFISVLVVAMTVVSLKFCMDFTVTSEQMYISSGLWSSAGRSPGHMGKNLNKWSPLESLVLMSL